MHIDEIVKQFKKYKLKDKGPLSDIKEKLISIDINSLTKIHYSIEVVSRWTNNLLGLSVGAAYEKYFVKPVIISLAKIGLTQGQALEVLEAMGIVSNTGALYDRFSLTRMLQERLWGPGQKLVWSGVRAVQNEGLIDIMMEPIIEQLIRSTNENNERMTLEDIGESFGRSSDYIEQFLKRRWGFDTIEEAQAFFEDHYLGSHRYDFYAF